MGRLPIRQRIYNLAQSSQTSVDLFCLIQSLPLRSSLAYLLTPRQIHQVQLTSLSAEIGRVVLTNREDEDHVGPRRPLVHVCTGNGPAVSGNLDELVDLVGGRNILFGDILDEDSPLLVRSNFQIILILIEQISQFLHIQFRQRHLYPELNILLRLSNRTEHMLHHSRNYPRLLR